MSNQQNVEYTRGSRQFYHNGEKEVGVDIHYRNSSRCRATLWLGNATFWVGRAAAVRIRPAKAARQRSGRQRFRCRAPRVSRPAEHVAVRPGSAVRPRALPSGLSLPCACARCRAHVFAERRDSAERGAFAVRRALAERGVVAVRPAPYPLGNGPSPGSQAGLARLLCRAQAHGKDDQMVFAVRRCTAKNSLLLLVLPASSSFPAYKQ